MVLVFFWNRAQVSFSIPIRVLFQYCNTLQHTATHCNPSEFFFNTHLRPISIGQVWSHRVLIHLANFSWWVLQHCTGFARLVWGRLRVHRAFVYSDWFLCYGCFCKIERRSLLHMFLGLFYTCFQVSFTHVFKCVLTSCWQIFFFLKKIWKKKMMCQQDINAHAPRA